MINNCLNLFYEKRIFFPFTPLLHFSCYLFIFTQNVPWVEKQYRAHISKKGLFLYQNSIYFDQRYFVNNFNPIVFSFLAFCFRQNNTGRLLFLPSACISLSLNLLELLILIECYCFNFSQATEKKSLSGSKSS